MKTDKIIVTNRGEKMGEVLDSAQRYIDGQRMSRKDGIHFRLLAEEMIGMVRNIAGDFTAYCWIEGQGDTHRICLEGKASLDSEERDRMLALRKSGGNLLAKGIMGKIKEVIEIGELNYREVGRESLLQYGMTMSTSADALLASNIALDMTESFWSLQTYRENVSDGQEKYGLSDEMRQAADELEQSIVANIADDVQVGALNGKIKVIVIFKEKNLD